MKPWQTAVRYGAIVLAVILIINIVGWGLKIVGAVLGFASSGTLDESKTYECDADTDKLEINISAAQLIIRIEKCESITVKTNLKGVSVKERSNTLKINDNKGFLSIPDTEGFVEIMIPEGTRLNKIDLDLGAGETLLSAICADEVDIDGGYYKTPFWNIQSIFRSAWALRKFSFSAIRMNTDFPLTRGLATSRLTVRTLEAPRSATAAYASTLTAV